MKLSLSWLRILWITFVLALPAVILYSLFTRVVKCPACYLFEDGGDGLKNYYTLDYYVKHDDGWHFSGMNYPYGEHIIYTDNQPILALTLRWIDQHITDMDRHVIGTLNMLMLISIYLAIMFTYLLLRRWMIGRWWAFGAALCIIFLSPQLWRLHGHYGLAYVFFLPLLLLLIDLLIRGNGKKWIWGIASGLVIVAMSLTHMYFLLLSLVVVFSILVFWWWYNRKDKMAVRTIVPLLIGVIILPGLFLIGLRKITDPIQDRPTEPWGIDSHTINFETTFFPFIPPLDKTWTTILKSDKPITERVAYVGMFGFLMLPAILVFLFRKCEDEVLRSHVKIFLWAGVVSWCMAAGIFYQHGFKFFWEAVPLLKQFRGLGRFGIPFYYLYLLVCTYIAWHMYRRLKERELGWIGGYILGAIILVWGFESWLNIKAVRDPVFRQNLWLSSAKDDYVPLLQAAGYTPDSFQAILQLPLVAIGNEMMGVTRGFWTMREGVHASTETGLPMIDYAMSRTSISQGMDIVGLISTPYAEKRRASHFNDKPILLLCEEAFVIPAEQKWIVLAKKIGTYKSITLYALPSAVFKTVSLPALPADQKDVPCAGWFVGFDDHPCDTMMSGTGALPIVSAPTSIWSVTDTSSFERSWIVSFWSHIDNRRGEVPVPRMMETGPDGTVLRNTGLHRESIAWSEAHGEWIEISFAWNTLGKGYKYELIIDNKGPVIDNLLIRPLGDTCIYHFPNMTLYNNLPIPTTK
ncbi:MAG: hypothetical protein SH808_01030 [Saprospiraceae bacterium]|nr:hypothetical protein [Saprospiraceae bacterium]